MNNAQQEIIISDKFREQTESMNIYSQLQKQGTAAFGGSVTKVDDELYILKDESGKDICGILDCKSFMEALMDTEVAHLWVPSKASN
jgi:hypothetical protein